jgi:acyl-coenzyme A thioesterase PaaI-like protein
MSEREGYFWDVMAGRTAPPPAAETLGFKLLEVDPEAGRIRVQFEARRAFTNPIGHVQGKRG